MVLAAAVHLTVIHFRAVAAVAEAIRQPVQVVVQAVDLHLALVANRQVGYLQFHLQC